MDATYLEARGDVYNSRGIVLLVEDNVDDVTFVRLAFQRHKLHHDLMVVSDGAQALDYFRGIGTYADREKFPIPSVVFLDLRMPAMNGFEMLRQVRMENGLSRVPIVVFTGSNHPQDVSQAYELGANSVVIKPFGIDRFFDAVKAMVEYWLECCKLPTLQPALSPIAPEP